MQPKMIEFKAVSNKHVMKMFSLWFLIYSAEQNQLAVKYLHRGTASFTFYSNSLINGRITAVIMQCLWRPVKLL